MKASSLTNKKNIVVGLGEIGLPILQLISKKTIAVGYDKKPSIKDKNFEKYKNLDTYIMHICIPFTENFISEVISLFKKFKPKIIVIHSTVKPYTTKKLQNKLPIPVIYSATRGIHKRMLLDLKRYTKFFAIEPSVSAKKSVSDFQKLLKKCGIKTKQMSSPITLELAKIICDTTYYGWLITYAQLSNLIAQEHKVNYDEMWSFSDEIHRFLGNRPKMFPGFIGGHCVIPNLDLIHNQTLDLIKNINKLYKNKKHTIKNSK